MPDGASGGPDERAIVARLARAFGGLEAEGVTLGIGDDAAILRAPVGESLVWTVDAQVEGVHFRLDWLSMEEVGYRSFVAAASDLFAMGARPWCALGALALPKGMEGAGLDALARGQAAAARDVGAPIVGGNLTRGEALSVTTTLLGRCAQAVTRGGARGGDGVYVAGPLGLARAGLLLLQREKADDAGREAWAATALTAFRRPPVLREAGLVLASHASAAIDVSDGLATDARRLAEASRVAIVIDLPLLEAHLSPALTEAGRALRESPLDLALEGGEDYALLATSPGPMEGFTRVGEVRAGSGLSIRDASGRVTDASARGFDHFAP